MTISCKNIITLTNQEVQKETDLIESSVISQPMPEEEQLPSKVVNSAYVKNMMTMNINKIS